MKVVIITGASSGIGLATAKYLTEKGFKVYGVARRQQNKLGFECKVGDVNDFNRMKEIFEEVYKKEGKIDALINNAGFGIGGALESATPENIYKLCNTNLAAVLTLSGMIIPYLKETQGRIVNISSVGGIIPLPYQAVYTATKAGVEKASRALATEVRPYGIKVISVLPGDTKTGFTDARVIEKSADKDLREDEAKSLSKAEQSERKGKDPTTVSKVIAKVLTMKNPPLRKSVGFMSKFEVFLERIASTKLVNWLVRKIYC